MKFFTRAWASGQRTSSPAGRIPAAYFQHLETLHLPPQPRALAALNLHDAHLLDVAYLAPTHTLHLRLRRGDLRAGYTTALVTFTAVVIAQGDLATLFQSRRPAAVEILYDEVDRLGVSAFEYRLLLHPVGEVAFQFNDVALAQHPVTSRNAPELNP